MCSISVDKEVCVNVELICSISFFYISVGTWSEWSNFSECSKTCGTGIKSRTRLCYGGFCSGNQKQTMECNRKECKTGKFNIVITDAILMFFIELPRF